MIIRSEMTNQQKRTFRLVFIKMSVEFQTIGRFRCFPTVSEIFGRRGWCGWEYKNREKAGTFLFSRCVPRICDGNEYLIFNTPQYHLMSLTTVQKIRKQTFSAPTMFLFGTFRHSNSISGQNCIKR